MFYLFILMNIEKLSGERELSLPHLTPLWAVLLVAARWFYSPKVGLSSCFQTCGSQSVVLGSAASLENLVEMHILRPHLRLLEYLGERVLMMFAVYLAVHPNYK